MNIKDHADANTYQNVFEGLMRRDPQGVLRPEALLKEAEREDHPLHHRFTWEDSEAAEKWRLKEAEKIIVSYKIVIPPLRHRVRALTSLPSDRKVEGGYRWTSDVIANKSLRQEALSMALKELMSVESRYKHLEELTEIWDATDRAVDTVEKKTGAVKA